MSDDVTHNLPNDLLRQILDGVGALGKRLDGMDSRLEALEAKSFDTKPLWERALAALAEIKQGLAEVKQDLAEVKRGLTEVKHDLAEVKQDLA